MLNYFIIKFPCQIQIISTLKLKDNFRRRTKNEISHWFILQIFNHCKMRHIFKIWMVYFSWLIFFRTLNFFFQILKIFSLNYNKTRFNRLNKFLTSQLCIISLKEFSFVFISEGFLVRSTLNFEISIFLTLALKTSPS